jgi:hypothetical protein
VDSLKASEGRVYQTQPVIFPVTKPATSAMSRLANPARRKFSSELKWVEIAIDRGAEYLAISSRLCDANNDRSAWIFSPVVDVLNRRHRDMFIS